ncbi:MAG: GNAT family N-acetyltransferase, partial [Prolixibacteraceae bacterium]|nr:GNAT family N-acetyltransferase [Prolixibacteraceae bacterium]
SVRGFRQNETCCIGRLIVHPGVQNLGIGQKMIKAIEAAFPQCKRFELFTGFRSEKNLYLYQKLGYREFRREKASTNLTLIFMEKWVR